MDDKPTPAARPCEVDPTPIPVRWVPTLTMDEAGEFLAALEQSPDARPADYCRSADRRASCPIPLDDDLIRASRRPGSP